MLNSMLDEYQSERLLVFAKARKTFPINANQGEYTIGTNGLADYNVPRPVQIDQAGFIFTNVTPQIEQPFRIIGVQEWAALTPKFLTSTVPFYLYYSPEVPLGKIHLFPVPSTSWGPNALALYLWVSLQQVNNVNSVIDLAPGYQSFLEFNLALRLAMQFPTRAKPSQNLPAMAIATKRKIQIPNQPRLLSQCEISDGQSRHGQWSIFSGSYLPGGPR